MIVNHRSSRSMIVCVSPCVSVAKIKSSCWEENMLEHIKVEIKPEMIIAAVNRMTKKERESFLEDLLASTAPDYLESIKEARSDYKAGRVRNHEEIFSS